MRRAKALWLYDPTSNRYTDCTQSLGDGSAPATLAPGQRLYIAADDWLEGLWCFVQHNPPSGTPTITVELYDGQTDTWQVVPLADRYDEFDTDYAITYPGYAFQTTGVAEWMVTDALWERRRVSATFPEPSGVPAFVLTQRTLSGLPQTGVAVAATGLYWVRLNNQGNVAVQFDRLLPVFYNTYSNPEYLSRYLGLEDFSDVAAPLLFSIKERIHQQEDIIDDYMRKSFRIRQVLRERDLFNPYGQQARYWPLLAVTRLGVWTGTAFQLLQQGRNQDYYLDPATGMIYYTRISLGRGLPWSRAASRYLRQPASAEYDYVYGGDFDLAQRRGVLREIVTLRVAAGLTEIQDAIVYFIGNPDAVPKAEKAREWREHATALADQVRGLAVV